MCSTTSAVKFGTVPWAMNSALTTRVSRGFRLYSLQSRAVAGERVSVKLVASKRSELGSAESRRLRRQGLIPGVLYGRSQPVAIAVAERDLRTALTTSAGTHAVLDV